MKTITIDGIEYQLTPVPTEAPKLVQLESIEDEMDEEEKLFVKELEDLEKEFSSKGCYRCNFTGFKYSTPTDPSDITIKRNCEYCNPNYHYSDNNTVRSW